MWTRLSGRPVVPPRDCGRRWRQGWAGGDDAHSDLPLQRALAQRVPAEVEATAEAFDPFARRLERRVGGAGRIIEKERLVGLHRVLAPEPGHWAVGKVASEERGGANVRASGRARGGLWVEMSGG